MKKTNINNKIYFDSEIISRNIITDWIQGIRNLLGLKLKSYNNAIKETVKEITERIDCDLKWYRIDIEQMDKGAFLIAITGERK